MSFDGVVLLSCAAAVVMAKLGASVAATDLEPNLPLLKDNCRDNGELQGSIACSHLALHGHTHSPGAVDFWL
jgi:hypothetical protein